ncbi:pro-neuregulin-3, membrane-bound isoform isoform X2 [Dunckerocampus dactyliophorus]|uniref:pro-neuregulin-3, membrane-bound isoform isoform X2 n=1 Tax=Dunckerocampus dactyliophorus TaxID=161453 RepID=UPI002406FB2E|nr:pro-neuregulin-3, membrane-bound isoform isoform X2 [Dunckerocampus dactyliophorus]
MSHKGAQGRMTECSGATGTGSVILEEPEGLVSSGVRGEGQARDEGPFRCALWPRQQTWLCVVPLLIGFIGLGLSLMLLKWIVVGTVRDYVPTDLVDANRIGQDPIFLSKPSGIPKGPETTTATATPTADDRNVTPKTVTAVKGRTRTTATTTTNPRGGAASGSLATPRIPGNRNGRVPVGFTTVAAPPRTTLRNGAQTSSPSPSNPTVLHDSTQMWTSDHTTTKVTFTTTTTRRHGHRKTPSPTVPPLHSEHFKPCHDKDLAYCLNGGECFVIETLSGPHKHCKCREGYQGIRCDQFLPKTDSILSDPNQLGIEFMESKEVYKRQLLSITSIAMAIGLLGVLCVALYCRNKRREKLEAHLKDTRHLKDYTNSQYSKGAGVCRHGDVCESSFANIRTTPTGCIKHTAEQRSRGAHWSAHPRRTPPIPRGRSKSSGPAYQHLQEVELTEKEAQQGDTGVCCSLSQLTSGKRRGVVQQGEPRRHEPRQDAVRNMQSSASVRAPWSDHTVTPLVLHAPGPAGAPRSLQRPNCGRCPAVASRSASIPIIPSVQGRHDDELSCMQTAPATTMMSTEERRERRRREDDVALLLDEAQEQLRALARRRQEDHAPAAPQARETVCFLNLHVGGAGKLLCDGPAHTQLLSPAPHRDLGQ